MNNVEFKEKLKKIKCVLLDLDGTVYLGSQLIGGAKKTIESFREHGIKVVYLTNNSSKTTEEYASKLTALGIFDERDKILTSAEATAKYIKDNGMGEDVYLLATDEIKKSFQSYGVKLSESGAKTAVLAYDTELNYKKMCEFNHEISNGAKYIATHADEVCPAEGTSLPDAGSFIQLFATSCKRLPDVVVGKPNKFMGELVKKEYNLSADQIMMVGDRLYTDIRFGKNCNFLTVLVLSGETTLAMANASKDKADAIFNNLFEVAKILGV